MKKITTNKIVLITNFLPLKHDVIIMLNKINDLFESFGFKVLVLSTSISKELNPKTIEIPFSLRDYANLSVANPCLDQFNEDMILIDAEFSDDLSPNFELYTQGIQNCKKIAHKIAKELKPSFAFFWLGTLPQSIIFKNVFHEYFIPSFLLSEDCC